MSSTPRCFLIEMDKASERRLIPIAKREKQKLNYRFHDPNPPGVTADYLIKLLVEVNMPKAEAAIRAAREEAALRASKEPRESVVAKLHARLPEQAAKTPKTRKKTKALDPEL